jgi:hypothetical protein
MGNENRGKAVDDRVQKQDRYCVTAQPLLQHCKLNCDHNIFSMHEHRPSRALRTTLQNIKVFDHIPLL